MPKSNLYGTIRDYFANNDPLHQYRRMKYGTYADASDSKIQNHG